MPFDISNLRLEGVKSIQPQNYDDSRGSFAEIYKQSEFKKDDIDVDFVQINQSVSSRNVLRGMHYQLPPKAQAKLVSVTKGVIYDVVVDLRKSSDTYGQWVSEVLSAKKHNMLFVPGGFAHGFYVKSDKANVIYYCTSEYSPEHERGIIWNDDQIKIEWPDLSPILSDKDKNYPTLEDTDDVFE